MEDEKVIKGVKVKFTGQANVSWEERYWTKRGWRYRRYRNEESYLSARIFLIGNERGLNITIPAGSHQFPFRFQLPPKLPSSFESTFGSVRYTLQGKMKNGAWKSDYTTKPIMFRVIALLNLNLYPAYASPRTVTKTKFICCLCCKLGPISIQVEIPRTGYLPEEIINFYVYCTNSSSQTISGMLVVLQQNIRYLAGRMIWLNAQKLRIRLVSLKGPKVRPGESESWHGQVRIPQVSPTNLGGCKIIQIGYSLKFKQCIPCGADFKKKFPLLIGTIPYVNATMESCQYQQPKHTYSMQNPQLSSGSHFPMVPAPLHTQYHAADLESTGAGYAGKEALAGISNLYYV